VAHQLTANRTSSRAGETRRRKRQRSLELWRWWSM